MIERVRLTANAKNQLITLKRKTGINHYNSLCRLALCTSLAAPTVPPLEEFDYTGGLEIDWRVFTGDNEELYLNLLSLTLAEQAAAVSNDTLKLVLASHLHRGLSYLVSKNNAELSLYFQV